MLRIGIIGANGQVGSEVCLLLANRADICVVPICRSRLGASFLEQCGLGCRVGQIGSDADARQLLQGLDLVADFSLPSGSQVEIRSQIRALVEASIRGAPAGVPYVSASTLMAFGAAQADELFRWRLIARTAYAGAKRFGERLAIRAGHRHQHPVYALRLGQVHGALQSVSRSIFETLRERESVFVPNGPAFAVFTVSVADALAGIAKGNFRPGIFTMVEDPQWSWKELWELYMRLAGRSGRVDEFSCALEPRPLARTGAGVRQMVTHRIIAALTRWREPISWYALSRFPQIERQARARYAMRAARAEIAELQTAERETPVRAAPALLPGKRIGIRSDHGRIEAELRALLAQMKRLAPFPVQAQSSTTSANLASDAF